MSMANSNRNKLMLVLLLLMISKLTDSSPPPPSPIISSSLSRVSREDEKFHHTSSNGPPSSSSYQLNADKQTLGPYDFLKPPPQRHPVILRYSHPPPAPAPSFMERIVSWFGFGGNNNDNVPPPRYSNTPPPFINEPQPQFSASQPTFLMPHSKFRPQGPPQGHSQGPPTSFHHETQHGIPPGFHHVPQGPQNRPQNGPQHGPIHGPQHESNHDSHHAAQEHNIHHSPPSQESRHIQQVLVQKQHNAQDQQTEECGLCNQFPWIPMFPGHSQLPVLRGKDPPDAHQSNFHFQHFQSGHHNTISFTTSMPSKFEPERYTAPHGSIGITSPEYLPPRGVLPIEQEKHRLIPIPVPNLSVTPIPPLYNAKPFKSVNNQFFDSSHPYKFYDAQPQISSNIQSVHDSISNHLPPNAFEALSISDSNLEIIKSIPVAHFTQSENSPLIGGYYQQEHQQNQQHHQHQYQNNYEVHSNSDQYNNQHIDHQSGTNYHISHNSNNNNHENLGSIYNTNGDHQSSTQSHYQSNTGGEVINSHTEVIFKHNEKSNEPHIHSNTESHYTIPHNHKPESENYNLHLTTISDNDQANKYIDNPIIVDNNHEGSSDSFAAASSHTIDSAGEETEAPLVIVNKTEELPNKDSHNVTIESTTKSYVIPLQPKKIIETEVEFQASVQTAADKTNSQNKKPNNLKKDRETPKNLLDSPIYYLKGTSVKPYTANPSETLSTVSGSSDSNNWTPVNSLTQQGSLNTYNAETSESEQNGSEHSSSVNDDGKKRPKQIQIIIPYTVNNKPSPFKMIDDHTSLNNEQYISYDKSLGWASHNEGQDYHVEEESKLVTATEPPVRKTTKYLTKILASNIRDLLKKEQESRHKLQPESFDIARLQKNIDGWTEQEFSDYSKASTISFLAPSKNIPEEYLTTSPATTIYFTNDDGSDNEADPDNSEPSLSVEAEHHYDNFKQNLNENHLNEDSSEEDDEDEIQHIHTTEPPNMPTKELWKKLKVSISPLTNEKVYVVTPQPIIDAKNIENESIGQFKSPRFIIRPTPGNGHGHYALTLSLSKSINNLQATTRNPARAYYTPELFGLMGKSGYAPNDTHDNNGKIITIVTPSELKDEDSS